MRPAHDVKCSKELVGKQLNCFEIKGLNECREHFIAYQKWKHKTWNDEKEFAELEVDKNLWYKRW
jgi:hypothetical protein